MLRALWGDVVKPVFIVPVIVVSVISFALIGVARAEIQIPSTLSCSALSTNPQKYEKFTLTLPFIVTGNSLTAERSTVSRPGKEVFSGTIGANKTIKIVGHGAYYNDDDAWQYDFSASIQAGDMTVLHGPLDTKGGAHRDCTLTFLRVQGANARVQTALQRAQRLQARRQPCSQRLSNAGVPKWIIETRMLTLQDENDSYLFELICPPNNTPLAFYGPSNPLGLFQFELGNTPVLLWFDLRDDDGSKTWSKEVSGNPTPTSRLILRRVKAGSKDLSAKANWESVNLLNDASLLLAMSALQ